MGNTAARPAVEAAVAGALDAGRLDVAATAAIRGYGPEILGYLRATLRDPADADEAFSMFCEDLWRGLPRFRRECPIRAWAYRLAWTASMRIVSKPHRRRRRRLATEEISQLADRIRSETPAHRRSSARDAIARLRDALSLEDRALLVLKVDRDLAWKEIAAIVSSDGPVVSEAVLRKRYERLKHKLQKMAQDAGLLAGELPVSAGTQDRQAR